MNALTPALPQPVEPDDPEGLSAAVGPSKPRLLRVLGPGLITGASDDDPSGIATYGQAGRSSATACAGPCSTACP